MSHEEAGSFSQHHSPYDGHPWGMDGGHCNTTGIQQRETDIHEGWHWLRGFRWQGGLPLRYPQYPQGGSRACVMSDVCLSCLFSSPCVSPPFLFCSLLFLSSPFLLHVTLPSSSLSSSLFCLLSHVTLHTLLLFPLILYHPLFSVFHSSLLWSAGLSSPIPFALLSYSAAKDWRFATQAVQSRYWDMLSVHPESEWMVALRRSHWQQQYSSRHKGKRGDISAWALFYLCLFHPILY